MCLIRLGSVYRALLDLDAAHATLLEAKATNENITPRPFTATIAAELCVVRALAGAWVEAHTYAEQVWLTKERSLLYTGFTCCFEIEAFLRAGDMTKAEEHLHYFSQRAVDNPRLRLAYLRALAVQAQWKGSKGQVIDYLERANALAEEIGLPGEQWQILAELGELYQSRGEGARLRPAHRGPSAQAQREGAREALGQAAEIVQALAAKIDDESVRAGFLAAEPVRRVLQSYA
jgi:tetratricopeptide (TPR) repeat protein